MMFNREKVEKSGLMELAIKVFILMERKKEKVCFSGKMVLNIMGNF